MMKLPLKYSFLLLFPLILVLPLPLMVSSVVLGLGLFNVLVLSIINGDFKTVAPRELGKNLLVVFGLLIFLIDSSTYILRNLDFGFVVRDVRISFLVVPIILWLIKDQLKSLRKYLLFSLVLGVLLYIFYAYGYLTYFYTSVITNRSFEFNHFLLYDLRENVPGAYHHSYIGMYMTFSIAILLSYVSKKYRWTFFGLASFILLNQVILGSKLTIAISFLLIIEYVIKMMKNKIGSNTWVLASLSSMIVVAIVVIYQSDVMSSVFFSASNRIESWQCALQGFLEKPFFGYGHEASVKYLENCITSDAVSAHNQYLEELLNYGLFGIWLPILFTLLFLKSGKSSLFRVFLILVGAVCLFENVLSLQRGVLFFTFFATVFHALMSSAKSGEVVSK